MQPENSANAVPKIATLKILASLLCVIIVFYYFTSHTPYMADNYIFSKEITPGYAKFYTGSQVEAIPLTIAGAFRQALEMYFTWCGRFAGNLMVYLCFILPPWMWHILSSVGFGIYIILLGICIFGREWRIRLTTPWIFAIAGLLWAAMPSFGEAFFWLSVGGQIALFFQAAMFIPYRLAFDGRCAVWASPSREALAAAGLFFLGVFTSSLDYATSAALPVTMILATIFVVFGQRPRKIPWHLVAGAVGLCMGSAVTLLAPGNGQRLLLTSDDEVHAWLASAWSERILGWICHIPDAMLYMWLPLLWLCWGCWTSWKKWGWDFYRHLPLAATLFFLPACVTIGAYLFTAWPPARAFATCTVQLTVCAAIISAAVCKYASAAALKQLRLLGWLLGVYCIVTLAWEANKFYEIASIDGQRQEIMQKANGGDVILPAMPRCDSKFQPLGGYLKDIQLDPEFWVNRAVATYYGLKSVRQEKIYPDTTYESSPRIFGSLKEKDNYIEVNEPADSGINTYHIYYHGNPGILSTIWAPLANKIYAWLAAGKEGDWRLKLIPIFMSRADIRMKKCGNVLYGKSELLNLNAVDKLWCVRPGKDKTSFDLIPLTAVEK